MPARETIAESWERRGIAVSRRDFLKLSAILTGALGLDYLQVPRVQAALQSSPLLPVIWLEFQDCAGCTESITRSQNPTLVSLVLNSLTIDYHETLMAAAGVQAEDSKESAMQKYAGEYLLVVEGSIPHGTNGYCTISGQSAQDILVNAAQNAAAVIAVGNCATFGGIPKAKPNPTDAAGTWKFIDKNKVVNIPGCPPIPETMTNSIAYYTLFHELPELDGERRPMSYYQHTIHARCLRRQFYADGKFADSFDDEGYRNGWCLYKLGCKGPTTYNACAGLKWNEGTSFPVQSGHPCLGCSEADFWDGGGFYEGQSSPLDEPTLTAALAAGGVGIALGAGMIVANQAQKRHARKAAETKGEE
jgi:hydrogenase small subunit